MLLIPLHTRTLQSDRRTPPLLSDSNNNNNTSSSREYNNSSRSSRLRCAGETRASIRARARNCGWTILVYLGTATMSNIKLSNYNETLLAAKAAVPRHELFWASGISYIQHAAIVECWVGGDGANSKTEPRKRRLAAALNASYFSAVCAPTLITFWACRSPGRTDTSSIALQPLPLYRSHSFISIPLLLPCRSINRVVG